MVKRKKTAALIQARLGSTRLPGKVLFKLPLHSSETILEQIIARAEASQVFNQVIVLTSAASSDDPLAEYLTAKNIQHFRGHDTNVLSRYYEAAKLHQADIIVRLTGDNPCIDPQLLKEVTEFHENQKNDYTKTTGLPIGMNVEVFSFTALQEAFKHATKPEELEHVTLYFYSHPELFKVGVYTIYPANKTFSEFRVTIDYPSDYALVNLLFGYFKNQQFTWQQLEAFWQQNPWITEINNRNFQKRTFTDVTHELAEAVTILSNYGLDNAAAILRRKL